MLLTYNEYNRDLGYVQGMSDLLAPIYAVMQDDAVAFWGFVGFMERMVCCPNRPSVVSILHPTGTELPSRPVGYACSITYSGSPGPADGPQTLPSPPIRRLDEFLLLLPHAPRLVQTRIRMGRRSPPLGDVVDRLAEQQLPPIRSPCHIGKAPGRHHGAPQAFRRSAQVR